MKRRDAFSLSEVLVAIVLISVLLILTSVMVSQSRKLAQTVKCIGTLKNLGVYFSSYAGENKGYLPYCRYDETTPDGTQIKHIWMNTLKAYASAPTGFDLCPTPNVANPFFAMDRSAGHDTVTGTNRRIRLADLQQNLHLGVPVVGQRWLVLDGDWYILDYKKSPTAQAGTQRTPQFRHNNRINILMGDLSAITLSREEVNERLYIFAEHPIH